jgi:hypothetical protein
MRTIGAAEEALAAMVKRLQSRVAFGKRLSEHSIWEQRVATARIDIEMSRLLCLKAADMMDKAGNKAAKLEIAMIKVQAPNMALRIIDDAVQAHGGAGVSQDFGLAASWAGIRTLRLATARTRSTTGDRPDRIREARAAHAADPMLRAAEARPVPRAAPEWERAAMRACSTLPAKSRSSPVPRAGSGERSRKRWPIRAPRSSSPAARPMRARKRRAPSTASMARARDRRAGQHLVQGSAAGLVDETRRQLGRIDILVCNAASNPITGRWPGSRTNSSARSWRTTSSPITG